MEFHFLNPPEKQRGLPCGAALFVFAGQGESIRPAGPFTEKAQRQGKGKHDIVIPIT
jgi:hypothetical protein